MFSVGDREAFDVQSNDFEVFQVSTLGKGELSQTWKPNPKIVLLFHLKIFTLCGHTRQELIFFLLFISSDVESSVLIAHSFIPHSITQLPTSFWHLLYARHNCCTYLIVKAETMCHWGTFGYRACGNKVGGLTQQDSSLNPGGQTSKIKVRTELSPLKSLRRDCHLPELHSLPYATS